VRSVFRADDEEPAVRLVICAAALLAATLGAAVLQAWLGIGDASAVYLLAIVVIAGRYGTWSGVIASLIAFLAYDFLFTEPRFTFNVTNPQEWLSLLLFLVVAVVIGRLAALQAERAAEADRRAREAQAMFGISRALATAESIDSAIPEILERLLGQTGLARIWIARGAEPATERVVADSAEVEADSPRAGADPGPGAGPGDGPTPWVLVRMPGDEPAEWIRTHDGTVVASDRTQPTRFRVVIEADGESLGSLWAQADGPVGLPSRGATRSLSLAADQLGLAIRRERLAELATTAEVARRSDALKSALLDSVSHDLRTPLATIRALAGGLLDEKVPLSPAEVHDSAATIDDEALRLSDIVRGLLDLSRIEAGELKPDLALHDLGELVETVVRRYRTAEGGHEIRIEIPEDLPVLVDALFFDQALTNVYDNALAHSGLSSVIRILARPAKADVPDDPHAQDEERAGPSVELIVEDDGPGVDPAQLEQVFDKFYRGQGVESGSRHGLGIGLTIARGLTEAMGARIEAGPSELGGLAITFRLSSGQ
jgi:two-component system, OmpR family, sensor histidine kinase KdpD